MTPESTPRPSPDLFAAMLALLDKIGNQPAGVVLHHLSEWREEARALVAMGRAG